MAASTRTWRSVPDAATLDRFAELIVGLGANVQPGQIVELRSQIGREPLTRAVAAAAYRRGARFVDFLYHDPWLRRARVEFAPDDSLEFVPDWHRRRVLAYGEQRCARVSLSGGMPAGLVDDLDPERAARDRWPFIAEYTDVIEANTTNWCAVAAPDADWAAVVHPELPPDEALGRLWEQVLYACRVDEPDPEASWHERLRELARVEAALNERRFDAVRFEGPGTDLTVGLLPGSRWVSGGGETVDGIRFLPNLPTEEIFTTPDPARVEGVVTATKPLELRGGTVVRGLVVRFEGGRAVRIDADTGAATLRRTCAADEGASRLGEVALVDGQGRVGALETVFYTTLLDENTAGHVAFGSCYPETLAPEDRERGNRSSIHVDFMLGGDDVDVTGLTRDGEHVPLLRGGRWQI